MKIVYSPMLDFDSEEYYITYAVKDAKTRKWTEWVNLKMMELFFISEGWNHDSDPSIMNKFVIHAVKTNYIGLGKTYVPLTLTYINKYGVEIEYVDGLATMQGEGQRYLLSYGTGLNNLYSIDCRDHRLPGFACKTWYYPIEYCVSPIACYECLHECINCSTPCEKISDYTLLVIQAKDACRTFTHINWADKVYLEKPYSGTIVCPYNGGTITFKNGKPVFGSYRFPNGIILDANAGRFIK